LPACRLQQRIQLIPTRVEQNFGFLGVQGNASLGALQRATHAG
jgi:hypothetical protein